MIRGPQAFCVIVRITGAKVPGSSVVPLTPVHTASDCVITISFRRPAGVWSCVRMVTGFVPGTMLHCSTMEPCAIRRCEGTGHAEPPEALGGWRTSGTIWSNAYPLAPGMPHTPYKPARSVAMTLCRIGCIFLFAIGILLRLTGFLVSGLCEVFL